MREADVQDAFIAWLRAEGWEARAGRAQDEADVVALRGGARLLAEVKGDTSSPGLDADTGWGQLLRRVTGSLTDRYALVGTARCVAAFNRVPDQVRRALRVEAFEVGPDGSVHEARGAPPPEHRSPTWDRVATLGHRFSDPRLLDRAMTHASASPDNNGSLASLGDRIFNLWVARRLYVSDPTATMGQLTAGINLACCARSQAELFAALGLSSHLVLGGSVIGAGSLVTESMAATALEALVAAIELDGGVGAADRFLDSAAAPTVDRVLGRCALPTLAAGPAVGARGGDTG